MTAAGEEGGLPRVSVVVLSHRRPHLLARVIGAIAQLDYPAFEVIVVGDQPSIEAYFLEPGIAAGLCYHAFAEANVSMARNLAVTRAAGEIVAFCDDDAVPEPDWLTELVRPFSDAQVGVVAGTVLGADGLTVEWHGGWFDRAGTETRASPAHAVRVADARSQTESGRFHSLMGVNSAFRRAALVAAGGFDQAYRYYLDETDLALRLAERGWSAAFAPGAVVHHLREPNHARTVLRAPRDLFEIAASKAHFCRQHLAPDRFDPAFGAFRAARLANLDRFIRLGVVRGGARRRLERQLHDGLAEGLGRAQDLPLAPGAGAPAFAPFSSAGRGGLGIAIVTGWGIGPIRRMRRLARWLAAAGNSVSCFSFLSGPQPPSVAFADGVWLHRGGTWRLDHRTAGRRPIGRAARADAEIARVSGHRRFDVVLSGIDTAALAGARLAVPGQPGPLAVRPIGPGRLSLDEAVHRLEASLAGWDAGHGDARERPASQLRRNQQSKSSISYP